MLKREEDSEENSTPHPHPWAQTQVWGVHSLLTLVPPSLCSASGAPLFSSSSTEASLYWALSTATCSAQASSARYHLNSSSRASLVVQWISIKLCLPVKGTQVWSLVQVAQMVKCLPAVRESPVRSLSREDPLEKEMATHSSTLPWKIPWTEEPGRLQPVGSQRVGHDWATSISFFPGRFHMPRSN